MPVRPTTPGALVRRTLSRQRRGLAGAIALITLWQVCEAAVPVLIGVVIDRAIATGDVERLLLWGVVLCVHFTVLSLAYRFGSRIGFRAGQEESHLLRTEVSAHVLSPRGARLDRLPGDVLAVATGRRGHGRGGDRPGRLHRRGHRRPGRQRRGAGDHRPVHRRGRARRRTDRARLHPGARAAARAPRPRAPGGDRPGDRPRDRPGARAAPAQGDRRGAHGARRATGGRAGRRWAPASPPRAGRGCCTASPRP